MEARGVIPKEDVAKLWEKASFSIDRIKEIEEQTHHDIVAFTRAVSETLGEERKWVHYGLTSTDVVDTANGYLIKQANEILLKDIEDFIEMLRRQALRFKDTPCIGRTHGIHADITCFGLKVGAVARGDDAEFGAFPCGGPQYRGGQTQRGGR